LADYDKICTAIIADSGDLKWKKVIYCMPYFDKILHGGLVV